VSSIFDVPVSGAYHLVTWLSELVQPALGEPSAACAIVLFTACVRLLLLPLARSAARGERTRAVLLPQAQQLRERHRDNPERFQRELKKLQQESGATMLAGCLPMLAQAPFFMVMYRLFSSTEIGDQGNSLLGHTLLGAPLGQHWLDALHLSGLFGGPSLVFLCLFALLAVVAFASSRWQARMAERSGSQAPGGTLLRLLPFGTVLFAGVVPLAAGLYLLTTTTWAVVERATLRREPAPLDRRR